MPPVHRVPKIFSRRSVTLSVMHSSATIAAAVIRMASACAMPGSRPRAIARIARLHIILSAATTSALWSAVAMATARAMITAIACAMLPILVRPVLIRAETPFQRAADTDRAC